MNPWGVPFLAVVLLIASVSVGDGQPCGPEGCSLPPEASGPMTPVVRSNYPNMPPARNVSSQSTDRPSANTAPSIATAAPLPKRAEAAPIRQEPGKILQSEPAKRQILAEFGESPAPSAGEEALYVEAQRVMPETPSQVFLSSSDINRIICPVDIKDAIYSKEKGLTVRLAENNAFVKFLVMKKDGKDLYATTPTELYIVCGESVYTMIAMPRRIPAQTVRLSPGKADSIKKNLALFSEVPFEKRIISIIKRIYTDNVPDSFTIRKVDRPYPLFQGLSLVLHAITTIDGEGLRIKEYQARIADAWKEDAVYLKEKDFLAAELAQRPVAVSIDIINLKKGETSRIFVVERTEGGRP